MFVRKCLLFSLGIIMVSMITKTEVFQTNKPITLAAEDKTSLGQQLNQLLDNEPDLEGALAGVSIRKASTGEIIYNHLGDIRLRPASTMKLLTAAAALSKLGENYRFTTEVLTDGILSGRTLKGNLYLKGNGDPTLLKADLDKLASKLRKLGVKKVQGNLIGDDSWYDSIRYSPDLIWSDEHTYYGAQVSALTISPNKDYDAGTVIIDVKPGQKVGQSAILEIIPQTNYVKIVNKVETVTKDGKNEIEVVRDHGTNLITVKGSIPTNVKREREWVAVWEPTGLALDIFRQSLEKNGIKVNGKLKTNSTPKTVTKLTSHSSMPLAKLLIPFLKLSNNGHAEVLVKEMGKIVYGVGSFEEGLEVLETELPKFGVNTDTLVIRDGSGISHIDLVPANEITKLLYTVQKEDWFPHYLNALPVAGDSNRMVGGTLRNRMNGELTKGKVKAKTGTISTVSSLSGYLETKSGEKLIFCIILNNMKDEEIGKTMEDKIINKLITIVGGVGE